MVMREYSLVIYGVLEYGLMNFVILYLVILQNHKSKYINIYLIYFKLATI